MWSATREESGSIPNPDRDPLSASRSLSETAEAVRPPRIIVAEDSEPDVFLIREALRQAGIPSAGTVVVDDGEKAIHTLDSDPDMHCPDLVILDINLPKKKGGDVLRFIRSSAQAVTARVLVVTSSDSDSDRQEMFRLGANAYFHKPSDFAGFMRLGTLVRALLGLDEKP